ncbi:hypothetical protein FNV43_RR09602 [Rhamnella rubrinervis]|uniref:Ubiquitin-like protease family profile domain-containing protein n=1 Tax=Rhamnella rubrinervis TaxID=2594499 RepID=A0A8K0HAR1_9ROSA|nr:hypothetical protein FNV43_RR09602 [Rhamnella rubrinervis]
MVEDLNYFNQYSWGLVSYNATLISLHKALDLHHGELNKSSTYSLGGFPLAFRETSIEDVGQPSHSSYNYDELKSCIEALGIKIDGVANDLGTKIDGVASDLGNFRLESMCQYQSIHNTMGEMFDYIKHVLMPLNIEDTHWVLAHIDFIDAHINFYDSTLSKSTYRDQFKPLWTMLPYILRQHFFKERPLIKQTMIQFSHSYVEDFPKQKRDFILFLQTSASASSPNPVPAPPAHPEPSSWCHLLSLRQLRGATAEISLLFCPNGSVSQMNDSHPHKKPITAPIPKSQVLGKVRDFLGVISEANEKLKVDSKENSVNYDIEVLTRNESQIIEMDLMLGIADLHTPEVVVAAESSITGCQPVIPLAVSSSGTESEDSSNGNDDSDY